MAGLWFLIPSGQQWVVDVAAPVASRASSRLAVTLDWAGQVAALGRVMWHVVLQPIALSFLALAVVVSLLCAALWTAVNRVANDSPQLLEPYDAGAEPTEPAPQKPKPARKTRVAIDSGQGSLF